MISPAVDSTQFTNGLRRGLRSRHALPTTGPSTLRERRKSSRFYTFCVALLGFGRLQRVWRQAFGVVLLATGDFT